jgi:hypothetical protein
LSVAAPESGFARLRGRYPRERVHRLAPGDTLPPLDECERLAAAGVREIVLAGEVDLRYAESLQTLRLVRDCVALNVPVTWSVAHSGGVDARFLTHLWPPERMPGHDDLLALWREFAFGVLYWRSGPGFVSVRDVRPHFEASVYTLDTPASLRYFDRFTIPEPVGAIVADPAGDEEFAGLVEAGLVLVVEAHALTLPFRIKKWPVPFNAV